MRLLNVHSGTFVKYEDERQAPRYGILSHRWQNEEISYQDVISGCAQRREAYSKLAKFCRQCAKDELSHAWIDTCCIDQSSSAELSEAINSMFRWYQNAAKCYVYLHDYDRNSDVGSFSFLNSEWFERGWTLQELIAPNAVHFYDCNWREFGSRQQLCIEIARTTRIPIDVLHGEDPANYSVAQRLSWAAKRQTTRLEDQAYCLLGLFDINMPMLYGEGEKAFIRLQEEIIRHSADQSIFAWPGITTDYDRAEIYDVTYQRLEGLLATSPAAFEFCGDIQQSRDTVEQQSFSITNLGLSLEVQLWPCSIDVYEAKLLCFVKKEDAEIPISIFLRQTNQDGRYMRQAFQGLLTGTPVDVGSFGRKKRISVKQGQKGSVGQVCHSNIMFCKNPFLNSLADQDFSEGFEMPWFNNVYADKSAQDKSSVALIRIRGSDQKSQTMVLEFGFDFDFNPYLFTSSKSVKDEILYPPSLENTEWNDSLQRNVSVLQNFDIDSNGLVFEGHRSRGMLIWFPSLNAAINIQKKQFMSGKCWTIDIQKANLARSELFSSNDKGMPKEEGLLPLDGDGIDEADACPICLRILHEPITTRCNHVFCQSCFRWTDVSITLSDVHSTPLNANEYIVPEKLRIICPVCGVYTKAIYDTNRQWEIHVKYPRAYRLASWEVSKPVDEKFPIFEVSTIIVGNTHKDSPMESARHDWTFFLRPSNPEFIAQVRVLLHPTYRNNMIIFSRPPFELRRYAWGFFDIQAEIELKPGYRFLHKESETDGVPGNKLKLHWMLDFADTGSQGWIKVIIERTKPVLSKHDEDLKAQVEKLRMMRAETRLRQELDIAMTRNDEIANKG